MSRGLAMTASWLIKVKKEVTNQQAKQKKGPRFKPIKCWSDALSSFFFFFQAPPTPKGEVRQTTGQQGRILGGRVHQAAPPPRCRPVLWPRPTARRVAHPPPWDLIPMLLIYLHLSRIKNTKGCICVIAWYTHKFPNMRTSNCCVCRAVIFAL